jgi:hypothetical protein
MYTTIPLPYKTAGIFSARKCNVNTLHGQGPAAIVNDRPILLSERMLHKDYDHKCSVEKESPGRGSQGARRQDKLIGGKMPVVK